MPATLTGANSATSHSADIIVDDQTRSWSSRIAATDDPFVKRGHNMHGNLQNMRVSTRQTRVLGNAVEERRTDGDRLPVHRKLGVGQRRRDVPLRQQPDRVRLHVHPELGDIDFRRRNAQRREQSHRDRLLLRRE